MLFALNHPFGWFFGGLTSSLTSGIKLFVVIEAKTLAARLRDLGMEGQAAVFDRVAQAPDMPYSVNLAEIRKWVNQTEGAPAYGGSPLVWARIGLTAHDFAIRENSDVPERKGSQYEPIDPTVLQDVLVDGMILNAYAERSVEDFPPTILTIVVQSTGRRESELRYEMRRDLPKGRPSHFAVSIDINPLRRGFGNTAFRQTKFDKELMKRVVTDEYFGTDHQEKQSEPSQKLTAIFLDALTGSDLVDLNHRYG